MTMGEYIKKLRNGDNIYGKRLSQTELGQMLNPPVERAAVNKWETGRVENLRRNHIIQIAEIFGTTPSQVMCFTEIDTFIETKNIKAIEEKTETYTLQLLQIFYKLNSLGKEKAMQNLSDLTEISRYTQT